MTDSEEYTPTSVVTRDGTHLVVYDRGDPDAENTVVFLHGFCLSHETWTEQVDLLLDKWRGDVRVISYDHRGHGKSDEAPMSTYRVRNLATDLSDVLDSLNVGGRVTLVGHSMGGMTILEYLTMPVWFRSVYPESVVLVATAAGDIAKHGIGRMLNTPGVGALYRVTERLPHRAAEALIHKTGAPLMNLLIDHIGYVGDHESAQSFVTSGSINDTPINTKVGFLIGLKQFGVGERLGLIESDTLILSGGKDYLTPPQHSLHLAQYIPHARHLHQDNCGHMLPHEAPLMVSSAIDSTICRNSALVPVS